MNRDPARKSDLTTRRLDLYVSQSSVVVFTARPDGGFGTTYITPNVERLVGHPPDAFTGDPDFWVDHVHPDDRARVLSEMSRLMQRGHTQVEYRFRAADGSYRWVRDEMRVLLDEDGTAVEITGTWRDVTDRVETESALARSLERIQELLSVTPAAIFSATAEVPERVTFMSDNVLEVTGYERAHYLETPGSWSEKIHPDDRERVGGQVGALIERGDESVQTMTYRFLHADGDYRWMRSEYRLVLDDEGRPQRFAGSWSDVTEDRYREEELDQFFRLSLDLLCMADFDGYFRRINPAFTDILGWGEDDLLGRPFLDFVHPEDVDETIGAMAALGAGAMLDSFENRYRTADGQYRHLLWKSAPDTDRRLIYAAARDITKRKEAEEELRRARDELEERVRERTRQLFDLNRTLEEELERRNAAEAARESSAAGYRQLFESAPVGIANVEADGRVANMNQALRTMVGLGDAGRSASANVTRWFSDPDAWATLTADLDAGGVVVDRRFSWTLESGATTSVEIDASRVRDGEAGDRRYLLFITDRSDRDALELQVRHSEKMTALGTLAGGIAHDFNNALTPIVLAADFVMAELDRGSEEADLESIREDVHTIKDAGARARDLTKQILAFSRPERADTRVVDMNAVVRGLEPMLSRVLPASVDVVFEPASRPLLVEGNMTRIEQVVMNLVVNARDAMPDGGQLTVETRLEEFAEATRRGHVELRSGAYAVLVVSDTGIGMDDRTRERIFEPFFTTKESGKGTGLGLATVYGIVRADKGHIHLYTEPGKGSSFRVYLPIAETHAPDAERRTEPRHGEPDRLLKVLVVDDDPLVLAAVSSTLGARGHEILEATDVESAVEVLEATETTIDVVVTDVVLHGASGRRVIEIAAARSGTEVVVMSGYSRLALVRDGTIRADRAFVSKPFTSAELLDALAVATRGEGEVDEGATEVEGADTTDGTRG